MEVEVEASVVAVVEALAVVAEEASVVAVVEALAEAVVVIEEVEVEEEVASLAEEGSNSREREKCCEQHGETFSIIILTRFLMTFVIKSLWYSSNGI